MSDNAIFEDGNLVTVFLKKTPNMTEEDYDKVCPSNPVDKPYPCVITSENLEQIGYPILYTQSIIPDTSDVARVVKIGMKKYDGPCAKQQIRIGLQSSVWEDWNGTKDNMCLQHTWRVGMFDTGLNRHDWAYCDGSFTLDPPYYFFPPSPPEDALPCSAVSVTDLFWLDLSGGSIKCDMRKTNAGIYDPDGCVNYRDCYVEWRADLDTVGGTDHQGKENIKFDITCTYTGTFDDDTVWDGVHQGLVYVELTDTNSNFVRLYFKGDIPYLEALGEIQYLVGDGLVEINIRDWGLTGDIAKMYIGCHNDFLYTAAGATNNYDRLVSYELNNISIY